MAERQFVKEGPFGLSNIDFYTPPETPRPPFTTYDWTTGAHTVWAVCDVSGNCLLDAFAERVMADDASQAWQWMRDMCGARYG